MELFSTTTYTCIVSGQDLLLQLHQNMKLHRSRTGFTLIEHLVVISIIIVLVSLAFPAALAVKEQVNQMQDVKNGKQIYSALKLFSTENEGRFPWADYDTITGLPSTTGSMVTNANTAFRNICPAYVKKQSIFFLDKSVWTMNPPDESDLTKVLTTAGSNAYSYVPGLSDNSNPSFPLIADAFSESVGTYSNKENTKGSVWKGKVAMVVRVDGSAKMEQCTKDLKVPGPANLMTDLFQVDAINWLHLAPVNPM